MTLTAHDPAVAPLLEAITAGAFDKDLATLEEVIAARRKATYRTRTLRDYPVGTRVRFNDQTGTRYLVGATGIVKSVRQKKVLVKFDDAQTRSLGRFEVYVAGERKYKDCVAPISILDLI